MDCVIIGLPCPLASGWVWPRRGTGRRTENRRSMKSKCYSFNFHPDRWLSLVSVLYLQPDFHPATLSMELFCQLCNVSLHLSFRPRDGNSSCLYYPQRSALSLVISSNPAHTLVNSLFINYPSNCPFLSMLFSCQKTNS